MSRSGAVGRNEPCPCGSGLKYKSCCLKSGVAVSPVRRPVASRPVVTQQPAADPMATARAEIQARRPGKAVAILRAAIDRDPENTGALLMLGQLLDRLGDQEEPIDLIQRCIALEPRRIPARMCLAGLFLRAGRYPDAHATARRVLELDDRHAAAHVSAAQALERMHRFDDARAEIESALALDPSDGNAAVLLALLDRRQGNLDDARDRLESVIERGPDDEVLYRALKELGLVLDQQGEPDAAFEALTRAGDVRMSSPLARQMDQDLRSRVIASHRKGFDAGLLARWHASALPEDGRRIAFLVGFPRSGTTLTGQILAAHPRVVTADEKPMVHAVGQRIARAGGGSDFDLPDLLAALDFQDVHELRDHYWAVAEQTTHTSLQGKLLLDKLPINIMNIGLINVVFPDARLVVALRDPRDVCLSCFMQRFGLNDLTINFQTWDRIARFYAQVMDLWLHYRQVTTLPYLEVRYEDTVGELEPQARRMLEFLDLEWDDAVLSFHEQARDRAADRLISTPSYAAITEKIYTRAAGRWRRYASHYEQVDGDLRRFIEAFGYADT